MSILNNYKYISIINPKIVKHQSHGYLLSLSDTKDVHKTIFFIITDKLLPEYDGHALVDFMNGINVDDEFVIGSDYLLSQSMADSMGIDDPNYIIDDIINSNNYLNTSYEFINASVNNIKRFLIANELNKMEFNEDQVYNFASTFAQLILNNAEIQQPTTVYNTIYYHVLEWLQNHQQDDATLYMSLILNGNVTVSNSTLSNCGCKSVDQSSQISVSCTDTYIEALKSWIATMFGDINFYYDWFFISTNDGENEPNAAMIDALIRLIEELKLLNLSLKDSNNSRLHNCGCIDSTNIDTSYISILDNYIKVLNLIKNCQIEQNKNKIKTFGNQFGGILPQLMFN